MDYIEVAVTITPKDPFADVVISALGEIGFESFVETETGFLAYINGEVYTEGLEKTCWAWNMGGFEIESSAKTISRTNWNEEWEKNFESILVDDEVYIYAPFHPTRPEVKHQILIEPKMSFGTGHHETTHQMVQLMLKQNLENKRVLDMGCGTGILAILAAQKGAKHVVGIDIDDWSIENTIENAARNNVEIETRLGGAEQLKDETFDVILANINLNILTTDMHQYCKVLAVGGLIMFSGFYVSDFETLNTEAKKNNLTCVDKMQREKWMAVIFVKESN